MRAILLACAVALGLGVTTTCALSSSASSVSVLPTCAIDCLVQLVSASPCSLTNQTCLCTDEPLQSAVALCVTSNCTIEEALTTENYTSTACSTPIYDQSAFLSNLTIYLGVATGVIVLLRLGYKLWTTHALVSDDWFALATTIVGVPSTIITVHGTTQNGLGRDIWTLTPTQITSFLRFFYAMEVLYFGQVVMVKLTLLAFYMRIFPSREIRRLLWGTMAFTVTFGMTFVLVAIFQCQPVDFYWLGWDGLHKGTCWNVNAIGWANAAISIVLDIWMLAIPLWEIRTLHLHWKKKIGVVLMFCVGTFVTIVSIIRLQTLVKFSKSSNPTRDNVTVSIWSTIEINVGIICTCLPTLRLLLASLFPVLGSARNRTGYHGSVYGYGNAKENGLKVPSKLAIEPFGVGTASSITSSRQIRDPVDGDAGRKTPIIEYQRFFSVQYSEADEESLVPMRDLATK